MIESDFPENMPTKKSVDMVKRAFTEEADQEKTYVYCGGKEAVEVRIGRTANQMSPKNPDKILDTMVEISPIDSDEAKWTKWVRKVELFEVE